MVQKDGPGLNHAVAGYCSRYVLTLKLYKNILKYPYYYLQVWVGGPGEGSQAHSESGVQHPERGLMLHHTELGLRLGLRGHRGTWSQCLRQGQCQGYLQRISELFLAQTG